MSVLSRTRRRAMHLVASAVVALAGAALADPPAPADLAAKAKAGTMTVDDIAAVEDALGPDTWRTPRLALSPRRHEEVRLTRAGRTLAGLVVYPTTRERAPVVVMIPEDQGLNRWAREMADEIAAMGYIVVAPDFLYGYGPNGGGAMSFTDHKSIFLANRARPKDEAAMTADLNAWADYGLKLPQADGRLATVGFAWGGGRAFWFATQRHDLRAAFIFYDAAPPPEALAGLTAPVYAFYATVDPRVTRSLPATAAAMRTLGKRYEPVVYAGSDHMFVRLGEEPRDPNPANILARNQSLARLQQLLAAM